MKLAERLRLRPPRPAQLALSACIVTASALGVANWNDPPRAQPVRTKAAKKAQIDFDIQPPEVVIYLDGKRLGTAQEVDKVTVKPGRRVIKLEKGGDTTELELRVDKGRVLRFSYDFED